MTPKEKAEELVEKFKNVKPVGLSDCTVIYLLGAKQCALIAVNEILGDMGADRGYAFWTEVKQEIEKL